MSPELLLDGARVTLSFHPDRLRRDGVSVAEGLVREGRYKSQFETGVTNGSPTAFAGGDRDRWERTLFGGAYHAGGVGVSERPKYGALNVMGHADGGSPRFGSCFLELRREIASRCTFTWGDSHEGPAHVGTIDVLEPVVAALFEAVDAKREALGVTNLDVPALVARLANPPAPTVGRALDAYIEAQVHSDVDLARDVEAIVVDPSFTGTEIGDALEALASRHRISLRRHPGFALSPAEVPDDFRGPRMAPLARRIEAAFASVPGRLDAAALGRAAASLHRDPSAWSDWATPEETWQHIKQLWHVLVRFG
ncbi:MAG: DUF3626 domain-containing protein [Labilithrix sp.]|nr:DUF3626 domain-containing protein [Labilithrix sp.]